MLSVREEESRFMRLYNIYRICHECREKIESNLGFTEREGDGVIHLSCYYVDGWVECKEALNQLHGISCLEKYVDDVYGAVDEIIKELKRPGLTSMEKDKFDIKMGELLTALKTIERLYDSLGLGEVGVGIDVKIPKCNSLKEYMDYLKEIDFIFTQCPFLISEEERIQFNTVDVGSQWLSFVVGGTAGTFFVLNNLGRIVSLVHRMKAEYFFSRRQRISVEEQALKKEVLEDTVRVFKRLEQEVLCNCVDELENEIGELRDGEERGRVEKSIEKMFMLVDKGVEIYTSIETPNEIKALFPANKDNVMLPDNIIELLEDKKSEESSEGRKSTAF